MDDRRPAPGPDQENQPFLDGARRRELMVQQCDECHACQLYGRLYCRSCGSASLRWRPASGRGIVYSYTVVRRAPSPAFREHEPYVLALVDLVEGPRLLSNLNGCQADAVRIGMPVIATFVQRGDAVVPEFIPVEGDSA